MYIIIQYIRQYTYMTRNFYFSTVPSKNVWVQYVQWVRDGSFILIAKLRGWACIYSRIMTLTHRENEQKHLYILKHKSSHETGFFLLSKLQHLKFVQYGRFFFHNHIEHMISICKASESKKSRSILKIYFEKQHRY